MRPDVAGNVILLDENGTKSHTTLSNTRFSIKICTPSYFSFFLLSNIKTYLMTSHFTTVDVVRTIITNQLKAIAFTDF